MLKTLIAFLLAASLQYGALEEIFTDYDTTIVTSTQRIVIEGYPEAFNPSLAKLDRGFILTFRHSPDPYGQPWRSDIGIVVLDDEFTPITEPQLLSTRAKRSKTPSQSEDARLFTYKQKMFLIYNDNVDEIFYDQGKRRDLFIAELLSQEPSDVINDGIFWGHLKKERFKLGPPLRLRCDEKYALAHQQKNWIPFEWQNSLFFTYSIHPHEILGTDLRNGACYSLYKTNTLFNWPYGTLRGSSDAQLVDGEYLAFFHSGARMKSPASPALKLWHYFMGAYTFSPNPPFEITKMTQKPIMSDDFYTLSHCEKRVVFPGGFVVDGPRIYLAYGKDDCEIWIATLDKEALKKHLIPVQQ